MDRTHRPWGALAALAAALAALGPGVRAAPGGDPPNDPYAASLQRALAIERQLIAALDTVCQSSVSVIVWKIPPAREGAPPSREPVVAGAGSGVLVSRAGKSWVVTNHHVAGDADRLDVVTCDGVTRRVELEDTVPQYDIALLRFTDKATGLRCVPIKGRSSLALEEGQWVIATGNPFGLAEDGTPVATLGVVSGLDRVLGGNFLYGNAIQHDAAVNPGNSGGPLWTLTGDLVGINGTITVGQMAEGSSPCNTGAAYAIPVHQIEPYLSALTDRKKDAQAGYLGLAYETDTDAAGRPCGARVTGVDPRGPAAGAPPRSEGLRAGDVIESLTAAGKLYKVLTATELMNALVLVPAGTQVTLRFRRGNRRHSWSGELTAPR